ncbi:hypothetical protein GCM10009839_33690 [Catenulispora yoronensis]|uniref:Uncharacterized protein n=1 Tax=Catenulispora yoronensis TaxID=450799 RepID=A0ABN2U890_9ACTN
MQDQKQITDTRVTSEPDDALKEFRLSAEEMHQAIADGTSVILSVVVEAAFYEDEWWIENRRTRQWVMADTVLAATLDRRRDQMREADAHVVAHAKKDPRPINVLRDMPTHDGTVGKPVGPRACEASTAAQTVSGHPAARE